MSRESLPVAVTGDPVQYAINRITNGWVIELVNDAGVTKLPNRPARVDATAVARVVLQPKVPHSAVREWRSNRKLGPQEPLSFEIGPGQSIFVELTAAK